MSPETASRPSRQASYPELREFYRDAAVAAGYDRHRFDRPVRSRRNRRKWRAITRALETAGDVRSVLDLPCGTGRFTGHFAGWNGQCCVTGADVSREMMGVAASRGPVGEGIAGYVQSDAAALPFASSSFDLVACIRFLMHVDPPTRVGMLREMRRVSRRWLVLDYRHCYTVRWLSWRVRRALGLTRRVLDRVSRAELDAELRRAGLRLVRLVPVERVFSDKWIVLCERADD